MEAQDFAYAALDDDTGSASLSIARPMNSAEMSVATGRESYHVSDGSKLKVYKIAINFDKWKSLTSSLYIEFLYSFPLAFSVYSEALKKKMALTTSEFAVLTSVLTFGTFFYIPGGLLLDKFGTIKTAMYGSLAGAVGYFGMFLATSGVFGRAVWLLYGSLLLACQAATIIDVASAQAIFTNFPNDKGLVFSLGTIQASVGPFSLSMLYNAFFGDKSKTSSSASCSGGQYNANLGSNNSAAATNQPTQADLGGSGMRVFLFFSFLYLVVGLGASSFLRIAAPPEGVKLGNGGRRKVYANYGFTLLVLAFACGVTLLEVQGVLNPSEDLALLFALLLLCMYTFPFSTNYKPKNERLSTYDSENWKKMTETAYSNTQAVKNISRLGSYFRTLFSVDFWMLFISFFGCNGASTVMIFSIAQINASLGGDAVKLSEMLSLIALSGVAGRIVTGMAQDSLVRNCKMPRSIFYVVGLILLGASQLVIAGTEANSPSVSLKAGVSIASVVFGMSWCVLGPLSLDMFGNSKYYGTLLSTLYLSAGFASLIFNSAIVHPYYQKAYEENPSYPNDKNTCCGAQCFGSAHMLMGILTLLTAVPAGIIFCKQLVAARKRFESF